MQAIHAVNFDLGADASQLDLAHRLPLGDLEGRTLSVGAPASGTELNTRAILEAAG